MHQTNTRLSVRLIMVTLLAVVTLLGVGAFFLLRSPKEQVTARDMCLNTEDYSDLTGSITEDELIAQDNFYTLVVNFEPDTTSYSDSTTKETVASIGEFYTSHQGKSMHLAIDSNYANVSEQSVANKRVERIVSDLNKSGIPEDIVQKGNPELLSKSEDVSTSFATISISSSDAICQQ